jgi:hypothetical protein
MNEHSVEIPDDDEVPDASPITSTSSTGRAKPLPMVSLWDILAYEPDPSDEVWEGGVLAAGEEATLIGAPSVGKSRIALQAAICTILGRPFLKWQTNAPNRRWLFLQTENNMRRLKYDMGRMTLRMSQDEKELLAKNISITNIGDADFTGICMSSNSANRDRIISTIEDYDPMVVSIDPMRDVGIGDLNADAAMTETCRAIREIVKRGSPKRIPWAIHHGRTGSAEASKVFGDDSGSFGRNSKVLHGWTRSQINVAWAGTEEDGVVIFGCGKNSNGPRWKPFAAQLDTETMTYHVLEEFDLDVWASGAGSKTGKSAAPKKLPTPEEIAELVRRAGGTVTGGENAPKGLVQRTRKAFGVTVAQAKASIESARGLTIQSVGGERVSGKQQALSYVLKDTA